MRLARVSAALVVAVCMAATLSALTSKRTVVLGFDLPNGARPEMKVIEGETATITLNASKVGLVPTVTEDANVVRVELFDLLSTPHKQIGAMEVAVGGEPVQSETKPKFGLRVVRVTSEQ